MKLMKLIVADKPKSFDDVEFTEVEWKRAKALGEIVVTGATAKDNIKNSKGLYKLAPEVDPVQIEVKALKAPAEMENGELFAEMASYGKPPRKQMTRTKAIEFVTKLREEASALIVDDEEGGS